MKKNISGLLCAAFIAGLTGCGSLKQLPIQTESASQIETDSKDIGEADKKREKILIAYFSVPENVDTAGADAVAGASIVVSDGEKLGNTEYVANLIQETIGGELFRIETEEEYPLDHDPLVDQASEEKSGNFRPELTSHVENFEQYETILLGYPNWWGDMPMPVYSFLEEYDFGAKTVIPFITHGGSGASRTVDTISELQPGALIRDNALILSRNDVADSEETVVSWAESLGISAVSLSQEDLEQNASNTASTAVPTPLKNQRIYLWDDGNMPSATQYTENMGYYADDPDFRPYMTFYPVPEGIQIKGAVLVNSGGAFAYRSNQNEGGPTAEELSRLGYQSFLVDYRVQPYTQEEGALDLARAVRFVRAHASEYGINEKDIAVMGFSAGGILAGEELLNFDGMVQGQEVDADYVPDELDKVSADAAAAGMIYSFYGRLSVATDDVEKLAASKLPPTFFCYGTRDPFVSEFEKNIQALSEANVETEVLVLDGMPHGYGNTGGWIDDYDRWLTDIFAHN